MKPQKTTARVLLVGVGRWGANHLRVWQDLGVELYVADPAPAQRQFCSQAGIPDDHLLSDFTPALDRVDLVDVVTPVDSHYQVARAALEAGKDVFVEKPLTSNSRDGMALDCRARALGRILQVGHIFRYDPATDFLRRATAQGDLGRIRCLEARFAGFKRPRSDCGVTAADGLHFIDLMNFLLGQMPCAVMACLADLLGRGMDDMGWVALDYGDAVAVVEANYFAPEKSRRLTVVGDAATAVCDFAANQNRLEIHLNRHVSEGGAWKALEGEVLYPEVGWEEPLARELRAFMESWQTRQAPLADGRAGYEVVQIIEAAQQSSESGHAIALRGRKDDAHHTAVQGIPVRRDQAEGAGHNRLRAIHPRAELHSV